MKDQHKHIKGCRDLTESEVFAMGSVKGDGVCLGLLVGEVRVSACLGQLWVSMAEESLQKGLMFDISYITKPTTF